jgi:F0F1-type ATP synthase assembly protein I
MALSVSAVSWSTASVSVLARSRPVALICLAVSAAAVVVAALFFANDHPKRGAAFIGVAVVAALGAVWFALAPRNGSDDH